MTSPHPALIMHSTTSRQGIKDQRSELLACFDEGAPFEVVEQRTSHTCRVSIASKAPCLTVAFLEPYIACHFLGPRLSFELASRATQMRHRQRMSVAGSGGIPGGPPLLRGASPALAVRGERAAFRSKCPGLFGCQRCPCNHQGWLDDHLSYALSNSLLHAVLPRALRMP